MKIWEELLPQVLKLLAAKWAFERFLAQGGERIENLADHDIESLIVRGPEWVEYRPEG
jgi:hypothetical protein